jgi:hypothetical protein
MKYKVIAAVKTKTNIGDYNLTEYALSLKDEQGKEIGCTILQKADSPAPSGEIEGDIEDSKYGLKFKKVKKQFGGGFGVGATHNSREHAQEMALRYASIQVQLGIIEKISKESLLPLIDWFDKDAKGDSSTPVSSGLQHATMPSDEFLSQKGIGVPPEETNEEIDIESIPWGDNE